MLILSCKIAPKQLQIEAFTAAAHCAHQGLDSCTEGLDATFWWLLSKAERSKHRIFIETGSQEDAS